MEWSNGTYVRLAAGVLATASLAVLAGCGVAASTPPTNYTGPVTLQGQVFAGRNYMAGATVTVYETQSTGVASKGTYTGTAKQLAQVTANSTGGWSLTGISCSSPDQLYVTAVAGTPYPSGFNYTTLVNNPNSVMLTAIGDCSILTSATTTNNVTSIVTNEASTVAAVWALRPFISMTGSTVNITSDASNYGGTAGIGSPGNYAGLAHAFLNANNLSPYKLGAFVQYTNGDPDGTHGGGLVPVQELNSLAYAQYLCTIGSDGTSPGNFSYCTTLYGLATPPGGTAPTNSLQAMLNIADYPANNATAILNFTLTPIPLSGQTTSQVINAGVYVPALTGFGTLTNDWSVALYFLPGDGATATAQGSQVPEFVTIDANDDVYFANPIASSSSTSGNVVALSSNGTNLWNSPTDTTKVTQPHAIAADSLGHVWVENNSATAGQGIVEELNAANGATVAQFTSTATQLYGIAVDSLNNVWYTANIVGGQNLHELLRNGSTYTEATFAVSPNSTYQLLQVRPDSNNNIWAAGYLSAGGAAVYFPNTGTAAAPTYTAGLKYAPVTGPSSTYGITTDATGNGWVVTNGTGSGIWKVAVTGSGAAATLAATNVAPNPAAASRFMDVDGLGNIWYVDNTTGTKLYQYVPGTAAATGFYPCYNAGTTTGSGTSQVCTTGISTRFDLAIDSTGTIWVASYGNSGGGRMTQIIGLAAPTVPLKSLGKIGMLP